MSLKFLAALIFVVSSYCLAQGSAVDRKDIVVDQDQFRDVAEDLRCPTCTGLSVLDSDAAFSIQIKNEVKVQMSQGKQKDEILKFFTERYGPWILRAPPTEGVHIWAWILPVTALLFGSFAIFFFVWRRKPSLERGGSEKGGHILSTEEAVREMYTRLESMRGARHE